MKYFYGNDYEEAIFNDPVEIKTTKDLRQYEECYNQVIPIDEVYESQETFDTKEEAEEYMKEIECDDFYIDEDGNECTVYYT